MADVEISYNNSVISSLSDSGTEVLETNGTFMSDDITVTYTSPGGGGVVTIRASISKSVLNSGANFMYVDDNGTFQNFALNEPMSPYDTEWYATLPVGTLVVIKNGTTTLPNSGTNIVKKSNISNSSTLRIGAYVVEAT